MKRHKTTLFLLSFFILLSALFMVYYYRTNKEHKQPLGVIGNPGHRVASFSFTDQDGKTITNKDVEGKIYVVEFFFTTCKGICPKMNENLVKVYRTFKGNKDVMILSHTVDPKKDTIGALKDYARRFEADGVQWLFLTGDKKSLYDMARYSYLVTAVDDTATADIQSDFIHTNKFVLVDRNGHIRGGKNGAYYDGTDPRSVDQLINDIRDLLKE